MTAKINPQTDSGRKLFYGLFIFPLLIAVGMAVLLCTVVLLTKESETPESLITSIKTGAPSKRWQKAFELSNELNRDGALLRSSGIMKEIIYILGNREEYDDKTRSYMAMALSHYDQAEAVAALRKALKEETSADVQFFVLWSLGTIADRGSEELALTFLASEREDLRSMAAYVLGVIGSEQSKEPLIALLKDPSRDIRWNAALSLARLGSDAGYEEILKMLDRQTLEAGEELKEDKIEEIMIGGIKGLTLIGRSDALSYIDELAQADESLKVRQAAMEARKSFQQKAA